MYRDWHRQFETIWLADIPGTEDHYLALFNISDTTRVVTFEFEWESMRESYLVSDLWAHQDLGVFDKKFGQSLEPHGAGLYRLSKQEK